MKRWLKKLFAVKIRRYNFIVGTQCLYSGLFEKKLFDPFIALKLNDKANEIAMNYSVERKDIHISGTFK